MDLVPRPGEFLSIINPIFRQPKLTQIMKLKNSRKNSRYLIAFAGLMLTSTLSAQDWNGYTPSSMEKQAQTEATFLKTVDFPKDREHLQKLTE